jgi:hypothetical protein
VIPGRVPPVPRIWGPGRDAPVPHPSRSRGPPAIGLHRWGGGSSRDGCESTTLTPPLDRSRTKSGAPYLQTVFRSGDVGNREPHPAQSPLPHNFVILRTLTLSCAKGKGTKNPLLGLAFQHRKVCPIHRAVSSRNGWETTNLNQALLAGCPRSLAFGDRGGMLTPLPSSRSA